MQLRLTNVANRQSAESQSAQLAQQINLTQKQFNLLNKHFVKKKSIKQISKEEKVSPQALYDRLNRIKRKGINLNFMRYQNL